MSTPTARAVPLSEVAHALVALSQWIDAGNTQRDPEAVTWGRIAKIAEEHGEVVAALIGATGQNPRKGITHTIGDVGDELLDVAVTALAAYEHLTDHHGLALARLQQKILTVATRAGVARADGERPPAPPAGPGMHVSRLWDGGDKERFGDLCPCEEMPCGHVVANPSCPQHGFAGGKTIRSSHAAAGCPAQPVATPQYGLDLAAAVREARALGQIP